jgi:hypothetical protein
MVGRTARQAAGGSGRRDVNNQSQFRSLASLKDASSARVLNLLTVKRIHGASDEYRKRPFFDSAIFNTAILLKHRLRPDDQFLFAEPQRNATKIILPFDKDDLRLGGTSFFYGQRGYLDFVRQVGNYGDVSMDRDLKVLQILNDLPSLDPFLIHERLQLEGIPVSECYFDLSDSDKRRMRDFVAGEISALISLAYRRDGAPATRESAVASASRFSAAILAVGAESQLEPLRSSLMLEGEDFRKGIFSWRGFLYYKWRFNDLLPQVKAVFREIVDLPVIRGDRAEDVEVVRQYKRKLGNQISTVSRKVAQSVSIYDRKYATLTSGTDPEQFRNFLLEAPHMFVDLGESFGGLSHIESFWRYRFPRKQVTPIRADEAMPILADFATSVGLSEDEFS